LRKVFTEIAQTILSEDATTCLLLGDIGSFGFSSSMAKFPNRVFNFGILEQSMIGAASGLASGGMNPIVHTIAPFLVERALEQIKIDFGYQNLSVNLVSVGASVDYSKLGATHHCPADISILSNVPNTKIFIPGTAAEFSTQFRENYNNPGIKYFRLTEFTNMSSNDKNSKGGILVKSGKEAGIIVFGNLLDRVLEATSNLDVTVVYLNNLTYELDPSIKFELQQHNKILCFEPFYVGSSSRFIDQAMNFTKPVLIKYCGFPIKFIDTYLSYDETLDSLGLSVDKINSQIRDLISIC
jgi:transketolase